jgi:hypothetical protein
LNIAVEVAHEAVDLRGIKRANGKRELMLGTAMPQAFDHM